MFPNSKNPMGFRAKRLLTVNQLNNRFLILYLMLHSTQSVGKFINRIIGIKGAIPHIGIRSQLLSVIENPTMDNRKTTMKMIEAMRISLILLFILST